MKKPISSEQRFERNRAITNIHMWLFLPFSKNSCTSEINTLVKYVRSIISDGKYLTISLFSNRGCGTCDSLITLLVLAHTPSQSSIVNHRRPLH